MTKPQPHPEPASPKQHRLLRRLAAERGQSFAYPATSKQADEEIKRLLKIKKTSGNDRRREVRGVRDAMSRSGNPAPRDSGSAEDYGSAPTFQPSVPWFEREPRRPAGG